MTDFLTHALRDVLIAFAVLHDRQYETPWA